MFLPNTHENNTNNNQSAVKQTVAEIILMFLLQLNYSEVFAILFQRNSFDSIIFLDFIFQFFLSFLFHKHFSFNFHSILLFFLSKHFPLCGINSYIGGSLNTLILISSQVHHYLPSLSHFLLMI